MRATVRLKVWLQPLPISEERVLFSALYEKTGAIVARSLAGAEN